MSIYVAVLAAVFIIALAIVVCRMILDILKDFSNDPILNGAILALILCVILGLLSLIPFERMIA